MIRVGFSLNFLRLKVVSYLEGVISSETGRLGKMVINSVERMDEIDHMYDDMQDRVFEIDKNRKNNLVGQDKVPLLPFLPFLNISRCFMV